jgi:hypothetical protein
MRLSEPYEDRDGFLAGGEGKSQNSDEEDP